MNLTPNLATTISYSQLTQNQEAHIQEALEYALTRITERTAKLNEYYIIQASNFTKIARPEEVANPINGPLADKAEGA